MNPEKITIIILTALLYIAIKSDVDSNMTDVIFEYQSSQTDIAFRCLKTISIYLYISNTSVISFLSQRF